MSHPNLAVLIGSAVAHILHPHHHRDTVHPFGQGVQPLGEGAFVPTGIDAYAEGKRRLEAGDAEAALAAFRQAVAERPQSADALDGLAVAWDRLGRTDLARVYYEAALAKAPESASIQNNLGYSYLLAGEPDRARPLLTRAALATDSRVAAAARRTLALMDRPQAARSPDASAIDPPEPSPVHIQRSPTALIERVSAARVSLITHPADPEPMEAIPAKWIAPPVQSRPPGSFAREPAPRAPVLLRASNPVSAERVEDLVLRGPVFDSDNAALNTFAARVHPFRARRRSAAATDCAESRARGGPTPAPVAAPNPPEDAATLAGRIEAALNGASPEDAQSLLDSDAGALPAPLVAFYKARLSLKLGDADGAALAFAPLTKEPGIAARAWAGLGEARLRQKRAAPAAEALDHALALDPGLASAWVMRGVAADMLRDWRAADLAYDRAIALDPRSAAALTDRGYSRLLRGRYLEALADLKRAIELDPRSKVAATDLRVAAVMTGDYKDAMAKLEKDVVGKEDVAEDLNTLGFAAMARGDYDRAETFFTRAMEINPRFDHVAWDNLVYLKQLIHAAPGSTDVR